MKLKINTKAASDADLQSRTSSAAETPASSSVKLKIKPPKPITTSSELGNGKELKKEKRKYIKKSKAGLDKDNPTPSKKRTLAESHSSQALKRQATNDVSTRGGSPTSLSHRTSIPTIKIRSRPTVAPRQITVKHRGRPPHRPIGVGYDSEADDVEEDPAIESQFILRMMPGEDCDYLKKAIDEKRIGLPLSEGGAEVIMRFLDREGRRALVGICGRSYAATLVDLPCVVEGMKSWDKRGWWKSADICQMLLVIGHVSDEEDAKTMPLPREIDQKTYQYPHGLTPPMRYVRKRRFRKRVSYRTIEAVEEEVERLLKMDESARADGGSIEYEMLDLDQYRNPSSQPDSDTELYGTSADAEGIYDDEEVAMAQLMEQELGQELEDEQEFSTSAPTPGAGPLTTTTNGTNSVVAASPSAGDESGEEEEDSDVQAGEVNEDDLARQQELAQQLEEIADLEKEIQVAKAQLEKQPNMLLRQRLGAKVMSLQSDLDLKKARLDDDND